jgi:hypothetical protein
VSATPAARPGSVTAPVRGSVARHETREAAPASRRRARRILAITQVYVPDPASVGQHMADACAALARRGHAVRVLTADRGYDDPTAEFARAERRDGVDVRRLAGCSFGKGSLGARLLGGLSFTAQSVVQGLFGPRPDVVLVTTVPPMAPLAALALAALRGSEIVYWVMDLNPDQLVALGRAPQSALPVRALDWMQRKVLARARSVVVLDRFMAARVRRKAEVDGRLVVLPPWPHEAEVVDLPRDRNAFREAHAFGDRTVVMYSGNHSVAHPLDAVLRAATRLRDDPRLLFAFVGGGLGKAAVDAIAGPTIRSLPYQPLAELRTSLSAADVHLVAMGDEVVGINHPCKVYGAMAVSRPILFVGPAESHVGDLLREHGIGWHVAQGDAEGALTTLRTIAATPRAELAAMGRRAGALVAARLGRARLEDAFCDVVEGSWVPAGAVDAPVPA